MIFHLELNCDNAAFSEEPLREVARILREEAKLLEHWSGPGEPPAWDNGLRDINGNTVGRAELKNE